MYVDDVDDVDDVDEGRVLSIYNIKMLFNVSVRKQSKNTKVVGK